MSWETKPLEDVADFCLGKMLDQNKNTGELMPYLANVNVRWSGFDLDDLREMRFGPGELDRYGLKYGDIVMCEGGEPGRCAIWKDQIPGMMIQKALHRIRPHEDVDGRFLFYVFLDKGRRNELSALFTGSTIKHLPREKLAKVTIDIPPLPIQHRISDILSAYDDLIDNNLRRISLLDEAVWLLYREWFIHLQFPGHEHVVTIDGLPEGWIRSTLGELAMDVSYGYTESASHEANGPKFLRITDIVNGPINWGTVPRCPISDDKLQRFLLSCRDVVVARTGATTGWARRISRQREPAVFASYLVRFRFDNRFRPELAATFMQSDAYKAFVRSSLGGAAQPNASAKVLASALVNVPADNLQKLFAEYAAPAFEQIDTLMEHNQKIVQARDLLLPRFMNGEIAV